MAAAGLVPVPGLQVHSDGSTTRTPVEFPALVEVHADPENPVLASLDIALVDEQLYKLGGRLYVPVHQLGEQKKLPVVLYFHGGGFVLCSSSSSSVDSLCQSVASKLGALVLSVDYRLAPEHRLPAAYEDAFRSVDWLEGLAAGGERAWPWEFANFSKVILMGDSAGGNIVQHLARAEQQQHRQLKVAGLVLVQPYFSAMERSPSETAYGGKHPIPLPFLDTLWALALPVGANRDHPFSNPAPHLGRCRLPKSLVVVGGRDPLRDRGVEFARALVEAAGGDEEALRLLEYENAGHGFYLSHDAEERELFLNELNDWVECLVDQVNGVPPAVDVLTSGGIVAGEIRDTSVRMP